MDKKLQGILTPYDVRLITSEKTSGKDTFIDIVDGQNEHLQTTVQYHNDIIYCLYFMNNQYFEQEAETLYEALDSVLIGNYQVCYRGILKKKRYIVISLKTKAIGPERITNEREFKVAYKLLPVAFTKNKLVT